MKNSILIDIHSHIVPEVDDGSRSISNSIEMLRAEAAQGVTDIICTPHNRPPHFSATSEIIKHKYEELKAASKAEGIPLTLHLGQEIATKKSVAKRIDSGELFSFDGTKYALLEFDYNNYVDINEIVYEMRVGGYKTIIAHVERYEYVSVEDVFGFIEAGAMIQVNADSLVSARAKKYKRKVEKFIKLGYVHFVASDIHYGRELTIGKAYSYVKKKYGNSVAEELFVNNAKSILYGKLD